MKTVLFLIAVLAFASPALAQSPLVVLSMEITNGAKVFEADHRAADNSIPTGAGESAWTGYLLEDLDAPLDSNLTTTIKLGNRFVPPNPWIAPIRKYVLTFDYRGNGHSVLGSQGLTFTDLSGLGVCNVTPDLALGFIRVESCVGTSNGTGELGEMNHPTSLDVLVNDGRRQLQVVLAEAVDAVTGDDLLRGTGCDPTAGTCVAPFDLDLSFTLTHYGRNPAVHGFGTGPTVKAHIPLSESRYSLSCDPTREITCSNEFGKMSCRQPHICNLWGDTNGDGQVNAGDFTPLLVNDAFGTGLSVGPDDNRFSVFDPTPFFP